MSPKTKHGRWSKIVLLQKDLFLRVCVFGGIFPLLEANTNEHYNFQSKRRGHTTHVQEPHPTLNSNSKGERGGGGGGHTHINFSTPNAQVYPKRGEGHVPEMPPLLDPPMTITFLASVSWRNQFLATAKNRHFL